MRYLKGWKVFESGETAAKLVDDTRDILIDLEDSGIPVICASGENPDYQPGERSFPFSSNPQSVHYLPQNNFCVILGNSRLELGFGVDEVKINTSKWKDQLIRLIEYLKSRGYSLDRFYFEQEGKTVWFADFGTGTRNLPTHLFNLEATNWIKLGFIESN